MHLDQALPGSSAAPSSDEPAAAPARTRRAEGERTRRHLLNTAGLLLAERDFAAASAKEIARRAGTPLASVHYHFGSREGLREAVLAEAQQQLARFEALVAAPMRAAATPIDGVRIFLAHLLGIGHATHGPRWGLRVLAREALGGGGCATMFDLLFPLLGQLLELPREHPRVAQAVDWVALPALAWLASPPPVEDRWRACGERSTQAALDDLLHCLGGALRAMGDPHRDHP
ncbi:transcriptional regulator, TetR family [Variovorax sp. OV329]|nr:transcriptional regulator, TetR family [Variovorax sp. OV329]